MDIDTLLKNTARTLYLSAKFMPKDMGKLFSCAYLICRAADSIADTELVELNKRITLIHNYPKMVESGDKELIEDFKQAIPQKKGLHEDERLLLENIDLCLDAFNKLNTAEKEMVMRSVNAVCKAMEWDLSYFPAAESGLIKATPNTTDTELYCEHMGGEPGIFWAKLLLKGKDNPRFIELGKRIGMALQITNILRDMPNDIKIGRIYLPITDLIAKEIMPQDLLQKKTYKKLKPIVFKWIKWGAENINCAAEFMQMIPRWRFFDRATVAWPVIWSLDTFILLASSKNLLDKNKLQKIPKKKIYLTMLASPLYCFSNTIFNRILKKKTQELYKILDI